MIGLVSVALPQAPNSAGFLSCTCESWSSWVLNRVGGSSVANQRLGGADPWLGINFLFFLLFSLPPLCFHLFTYFYLFLCVFFGGGTCMAPSRTRNNGNCAEPDIMETVLNHK